MIISSIKNCNMFVDYVPVSFVDYSTWDVLTVAFATYCLYVVLLVVYRLYSSPLSSIPGSKLAAATGWYETYYQLVKKGGGQFTFKIAEWHRNYGIINTFYHYLIPNSKS